MGTKKISELTELETLSNNDLVAVVDTANQATKKMTAKKLGAATGIPTNAIIGYDGNTIPSGYEEIDNPFNYSTDEIRIGTWTDGKPLYQKVIYYNVTSTIGQAATFSDILIPHNISNMETCWENISGLCTADKTQARILPTIGGSTNVTYGTFVLTVDRTNILLRIINDTWSTSNFFYFILKYTKTTD